MEKEEFLPMFLIQLGHMPTPLSTVQNFLLLQTITKLQKPKSKQ